MPRVVLESDEEKTPKVDDPTPDLNAYALVGEFVTKTGSSEAAKTYLAGAAAREWDSVAEPTIIANSPSTRPESVPTGDADVVVVLLEGATIGRLGPLQNYYASVQNAAYRFTVTRQPSGQWRITEAPDTVLITESAFATAYSRVNLQFFDPDESVLVPDPRFVPALPREGLEAKVVGLLLTGPSDSLKGAVANQLDGLVLRTNVLQEPDGAIKINFASVDKSTEERRKIIAQLVYTLSDVTTSPLRIQSEDRQLLPQQEDWRQIDLDPFEKLTTSRPDLVGQAVTHGRVVSLRDGRPISGPAGSGAYDIASAGLSLDGSTLAVVQRTSTGPRLRVGPVDGDLPEISMTPARSLTRPTWLHSASENTPPNEVWTVQDGAIVNRVARGPEGGWDNYPVEATELTRGGGEITDLRLSRDGVRLVAVIDGQVRIAPIIRDRDGGVAVQSPLTIQGGVFNDVVSVDWLDRQTLIVATNDISKPVAALPIDGYSYTIYNSANLTLPVSAITAGPAGRRW
ncbi:LpqB family beta-propeller domain-containing protein [Actinokineospora sp. G85]|uniref:LpqB family beta-propeller domain-containing protein n=1 Tax=Actinokineospora sp. G85 TaxID=3406626 RepID=UPI003C741D46